MGGNGETLQAVIFEDLPTPLAVVVILVGLVDVKMIAPAGEFDAVIAKALRFLADGLKRQIGPLTGEQSNCTRHVETSFERVVGEVIVTDGQSERRKQLLSIVVAAGPTTPLMISHLPSAKLEFQVFMSTSSHDITVRPKQV